MNDSKELRGLRHAMQGWSWVVYCVLLLASSVPFIIVGRLVMKDLDEFESAGRRDGISMAGERETGQWELPTSTAPASVQSPIGAGDDGVDASVFTETDRRKAAAALARAGDLPGALALLSVNRAGRELSRSAADAAVAKMRASMPARWNAQLDDLRLYWHTLKPADQQALYATNQEVNVEILTNLLKQTSNDQRKLADALPDSLTYALLVNIHADMTQAVDVPSIVIELYLDSLFERQSRAKRLYWRSPKTVIELTDHLNRYCQALTAYDLWPHMTEVVIQAKKHYAEGDAETRDWLKEVWGAAFTRELAQFDVTATNAHASFPWEQLRPEATRLWSDRVGRALGEDDTQPLSPAVVTNTPWLVAANRPLDHAYALTAVRLFPGWQRALRNFDYGMAKEAAFEALGILNAGRFYVRPTAKGPTIALENLLKNLNLERRAAISNTFPWLALIAELGGIADGTPAYVRKARGRKTVTPRAGKRWSQVNPVDARIALRKVASHRGVDKRFLNAFIKIFSENRNLKPDRQP